MKNINVSVSCTSYLPERSPVWSKSQTKFHVGSYGAWADDIFSNADVNAVVCVFEDLNISLIEDPERNVELFTPFLQQIKKRLLESKTPLIVILCSSLGHNPITASANFLSIANNRISIAKCLGELKSAYDHLYFIDLNDCHSDKAHQTFSMRNWYASRCRFSLEGIKHIENIISQIASRIYTPRKKILILDCDNTIWKGVVGEDGISGIELGLDGEGKIFQDFQRAALRISDSGVLLALASKNEERDVLDVLENHPECLIKNDHLVATKINWDEKSVNIQNLADELDLGLSSFVFWDDNPVEREKVKKLLPDVHVVNVPDDISEWPSFLQNMPEFGVFKMTAEDLGKNQQYKARAAFATAVKQSEDIDTYLKSISMRPTTVEFTPATSTRAEQLCQKTNQYNVRTIRYLADDLELLNKKLMGGVFMVNLSDIYADHGNIGLVVLKELSDETLFIDTFLLSCRVLGRKLERWVVSRIVNYANINGYSKIIGNFIQSDRNSVSKSLFDDDNNFKSVQPLVGISGISGEGEFYQLDVSDYSFKESELFNE